MNQETKLSARSKWAYSLGGIGRDMTYTLVATFFMTYIQFAVGLSVAQFSVIGILLIAGRIWDAVNDPIMGAIIENTRSKWGKFKPWILIGAVFTAIVIIVMFNWRPVGNNGWNFVIFFGVIYLLWEIAFTMNDIAYWSMLPSLTTDAKQRNSVTTLAVVFAGVGAFVANAGISFLTVGNAWGAIKGYSIIAIVIAIFLVGCQCLTVFGVKQAILTTGEVEEQNVSIKKMVNVIRKNDQLLWIVLAMLLYNIGSGLFVALGYNFIYLELGYDGTLALVFVATFGVSNIGIQAFYSKLAAKFGRKKLLLYSLVFITVGYLLLLFADIIPFFPINIFTICLFGVLVFSGQAIFYMILTVNIANTVEYNEYKTGERNEAVIFSLRPFMAKMASAIQQGVVTLVLATSGIYLLSQNINFLEEQKNYYDNDLSIEEQLEYEQNLANHVIILDNEKYNDKTSEEKEELYEMLNSVSFEVVDGNRVMSIKSSADDNFRDKANTFMRYYLRVAITIVPILFIYLSYLVLKKKFTIDEEMYEMMIAAIKKRQVE
jgi:melibiose permease/lactose/raffinose/galactose permease